MGRVAVSDELTAQQNASQLDAALGDVPWREAFSVTGRSGEPTQAAIDVARMFGESIRTRTGCPNTAIEVRSRPDQLPKYLLMLFSIDERAHWDFADQASKAYVDWLHHCDTEDFEANVLRNETHGILSLFAEEAPRLEDIESALKRQAAEYLPLHLSELLQATRSIRPVSSVEDIYGTMLGRARVTHVRAAIKELHTSELIDDNGVGDFWLRDIHWTGA